jgi:MEMO1 family protein
VETRSFDLAHITTFLFGFYVKIRARMSAIPEVRPSPIAGTWYSSNPVRLRQQIDAYLDMARLPDLPGHVTGVIAPHAGHRFSGRTAGHAFAAVRGQQRELVAVVAPLHDPHPSPLLTSAHRAYSTPLGPVQVDRPAQAQLESLLAQAGLPLTPIANDQEHALEIELPFLQCALAGDFLLLPVMVRSQSPLVARQLGLALAQVMHQRGGLLVASTDLSHFYPHEIAEQLDAEMLRRIRDFEPDELFTAEKTGQGFACGTAAVAAVLWAAREMGADRVEVLHHSNSGDETGDFGSVVGYGAAVILKQA